MTKKQKAVRRRGQKAKGKGLRKASVRPKPVMRWNPDADEVQKSVIKLVLTLVELLRKLMERQAIRRMEDRTMTAAETEAVGKALMEIEQTVREIGRKFDLDPEDL